MNSNTNNKRRYMKIKKRYITVHKYVFYILVAYFIISTTLIIFNIAVSKIPPVEMYDTVARNELRTKLNSNDQDTIEYYKTNFIENDLYLFDGPLTFKLMGEKYDLSSEKLIHEYNNSKYQNAQDFFNKEVEPAIKSGNISRFLNNVE